MRVFSKASTRMLVSVFSSRSWEISSSHSVIRPDRRASRPRQQLQPPSLGMSFRSYAQSFSHPWKRCGRRRNQCPTKNLCHAPIRRKVQIFWRLLHLHRGLLSSLLCNTPISLGFEGFKHTGCLRHMITREPGWRSKLLPTSRPRSRRRSTRSTWPLRAPSRHQRSQWTISSA